MVIETFEQFWEEAKKHNGENWNGWVFGLDAMPQTVYFSNGIINIYATFKYDACEGIPIQVDNENGLICAEEIKVDKLKDWCEYIELVLPFLEKYGGLRLTAWEKFFIEECIGKELELHDKDNFATKEEADKYVEKVNALLAKFQGNKVLIRKILNRKVTEIFDELVKWFKLKSGDFGPDQYIALERQKEYLTEIFYEYVCQNITKE